MEIIVDLCNQHHGSLLELKRMALNAFSSGADTVKVQLMDSEKFFGNTNKKYRDISFEEAKEFKAFCDLIGVEFMASVFDEERLEWLQELGVKRHKIASKIAKNNPKLCEKILAENKETFISTGMLKKNEFPYGFEDNIKYLFCVSKYPTQLFDKDLKGMPKKMGGPNSSKTRYYYGYSDHTIGIAAPLKAYINGAQVLEKHFSNNPNAQSKYEGAHLCSFDEKSLKTFKDLIKELNIMEVGGRYVT